jgi:hypothetical protein
MNGITSIKSASSKNRRRTGKLRVLVDINQVDFVGTHAYKDQVGCVAVSLRVGMSSGFSFSFCGQTPQCVPIIMSKK